MAKTSTSTDRTSEINPKPTKRTLLGVLVPVTAVTSSAILKSCPKAAPIARKTARLLRKPIRKLAMLVPQTAIAVVEGTYARRADLLSSRAIGIRAGLLMTRKRALQFAAQYIHTRNRKKPFRTRPGNQCFKSPLADLIDGQRRGRTANLDVKLAWQRTGFLMAGQKSQNGPMSARRIRS